MDGWEKLECLNEMKKGGKKWDRERILSETAKIRYI